VIFWFEKKSSGNPGFNAKEGFEENCFSFENVFSRFFFSHRVKVFERLLLTFRQKSFSRKSDKGGAQGLLELD
jgi:hypothetical protein